MLSLRLQQPEHTAVCHHQHQRQQRRRPTTVAAVPRERADAVRGIFELLDQDRDGFLSRKEYKTFCLRTESRDVDEARWASHCGPDGLRVAQPGKGISLEEFRQLFSSRAFPRHWNKAAEDLDTLLGGSARRRQQRRRAATAQATASRHGRCGASSGVQRCVAMASLPQANRAQSLLERLAAQVAPEMRRRGWHVGTLREFLPRQASLEGLNFENGKEIRMRLRDDTAGAFMAYERLVLTLLHELAHIEVTAHDGAFFQLLSELVRGCGVPRVHDCYIRQRAVSWACAGCCRTGFGPSTLSSAPTVSRQNLQQLFSFT